MEVKMETHYVCTGSCKGVATEEEYDNGAKTCGDPNCEKHGQALVKRNYCPKCDVHFEGEEHSCKEENIELNTPKDPANMTDFEKKHTPAIEISGNKVIVKVGEGIAHPMEKDHYITYIELFKDSESLAKKELKPTDEPMAEFENIHLGELKARALCNLHGLWQSL